MAAQLGAVLVLLQIFLLTARRKNTWELTPGCKKLLAPPSVQSTRLPHLAAVVQSTRLPHLAAVCCGFRLVQCTFCGSHFGFPAGLSMPEMRRQNGGCKKKYELNLTHIR